MNFDDCSGWEEDQRVTTVGEILYRLHGDGLTVTDAAKIGKALEYFDLDIDTTLVFTPEPEHCA